MSVLRSICFSFLVLFFIVDYYDHADALLPWDTLPQETGIQILAVNKQYPFVGEQLTVQCEVPTHDASKGITSDQLSFERRIIGDPPNPNTPTSLCFDSTDIDLPSLTTAVLNITVTMTMTSCYYCYSRPGCQKGSSIGLSNDVFVDYAPQEVTDFSCVVLNWEAMRCSWKDPVTYAYPDTIHVNLVYGSSRGSLSNHCPRQTNHSCEWPVIGFPNKYVMMVTVTRRDVSVNSVFEINPNHIVKPNAVNDLRGRSSPNKLGCFHLEWKYPKEIWNGVYDEPNLIFRVKSQRVYHQQDQNMDFKVWVNNPTATHYDACGFPAFTHVNFSVDVHPAGVFDGSWSDPQYFSGWSPQEIPASGPSITPGSFVVNKLSDAKDNETILYWNPVPESERNGIINGYLLQTSDGGERSLSNEATSTNMVLDINGPISISLYAHNLAGLSRKASVWHINPVDMRVSESIRNSFVAKVVKEDVILYWTPRAEHHNVTVYWCYGSSPVGKCERPLQWSRVENAIASHYTIPQLAANSYKYSYGLSVANPNSNTSSGIFWTQCLITSGKPSQTTITSDRLVSAVRVSWERHVCSYQSGFLVDQIVVKWCVKSECEDSSNVESKEIGPSNSSYVINNLQAGTEYQVTMETVSSEGLKEQADWIDVVPLKEKSKVDAALTTIIVVSVVVGVIVVACIITMIKCCHDRHERVKKDPDMLKSRIHRNLSSPGPIAESSLSSNYVSTNSGDSGTVGSNCTMMTLINEKSERGVCIHDDAADADDDDDAYDDDEKEDDDASTPVVPSTPCPALPQCHAPETIPIPQTNRGYEDSSNQCVAVATDSSDDLGCTKVSGEPPKRGLCENKNTEIEGYSNNAFQASNYVDANSSSVLDQASDTPYHRMTLAHSSGETASSSLPSLSSDGGCLDGYLPNTAVAGYIKNEIQNIKLCVVPPLSHDNTITDGHQLMPVSFTNIQQNALDTPTDGYIRVNDCPVLTVNADNIKQTDGYTTHLPTTLPISNENTHKSSATPDSYVGLPDNKVTNLANNTSYVLQNAMSTMMPSYVANDASLLPGQGLSDSTSIRSTNVDDENSSYIPRSSDWDYSKIGRAEGAEEVCVSPHGQINTTQELCVTTANGICVFLPQCLVNNNNNNNNINNNNNFTGLPSTNQMSDILSHPDDVQITDEKTFDNPSTKHQEWPRDHDSSSVHEVTADASVILGSDGYTPLPT